MNKTLLKIIASREDISDYLFHFTKGRNAFESLLKIIDSKSIIDINSNGYICFTEAPVTTLDAMFKIFENYQDPMYAPYGVAIKKGELFNLGARPVIYGTGEELTLMDNSLHWRFVQYKPCVYDFSWLREWRINTDKININIDNCFIVIKNKAEDSILFSDSPGDFSFDGDIADGQYWGEAYADFDRLFKGVSLEDVCSFNKLSKSKIQELLSTQSGDDMETRSLGGFAL